MTATITITIIIITTTIILTTNVILTTTVILTIAVTITPPGTTGVITAEIFSVTTATTAIIDLFWKVEWIDVVTIYTKPGKVSELI